jgi:hypothetical protein
MHDNEHGHHSHEGHDHQQVHRDPRPYWKRAHHDWRFLAAVALMLVGIVIYVMTNDLAGPPRVQSRRTQSGTVNK